MHSAKPRNQMSPPTAYTPQLRRRLAATPNQQAAPPAPEADHPPMVTKPGLEDRQDQPIQNPGLPRHVGQTRHMSP